MKKIITVLAALAVTSVAAFAGPAISVGGGFGVAVEQKDGVGEDNILGSPVLSLKADFQWEKFGLAADFDFNLGSIDCNWYAWPDKETLFSESLLLTPYVNLNAGEFNFNIGPTFGMKFEQNKKVTSTYTETRNPISLLCGGTVNCNYKISDKLNVYLEIPVICNNIFLSNTRTVTPTVGDPTTTSEDSYVARPALYVVPKMGLTYTF